MKTFLANPPWRRGSLYGIRAGSRWPFMLPVEPGDRIPRYMPMPFFLAYAAALLEKNGKETLLVDALAEGFTDSQFLDKAKAFAPGLIVIETATPSIYVDLAWAKKLKEALPQARIALCGPHATAFAADILNENPAVDFVLRGEYEFILLELVNSLENAAGLSGVKGLAHRDAGTKKAVLNSARPLERDINVFPWPARHFLPMLNYNDSFSGLPSPNAQVWASRGCPFECVFCLWPKTMYGGRAYRTRDVKDVIDEVESLIKNYGIKAFYFDDDTFNIGDDRIRAICAEIKKRGIKIPWAVMARADTSGRELLKEMKDAGLWAIKFGVESGVQKIVDDCGKGLDLGKVLENTMSAKELGVKVHHTYTFGLPGETEATVNETIRFAKAADPDSVQFSVVTPFPGTAYYDALDKKGFITSKNWEDYDGANRAVIRTETLSGADLTRLCAKAVREWNGHVLRTRLLKHPLRTLINALKKPDYAIIYIRNLFKR